MKLDEKLKVFSERYRGIREKMASVSKEMAEFDNQFIELCKEDLGADGDMHTSDILMKYREALEHEKKKELFLP